MPISQTFLHLQENKKHFLKLFDHSLLRLPKIMEIGLTIPAEKRDEKT